MLENVATARGHEATRLAARPALSACINTSSLCSRDVSNSVCKIRTRLPYADAACLQGNMSGLQVVLASSLLIGCAAASLALYFYSRRYVGQLQYLPDAVEPRLCLSVLDFWGHRQACPLPLRATHLPPVMMSWVQ